MILVDLALVAIFTSLAAGRRSSGPAAWLGPLFMLHAIRLSPTPLTVVVGAAVYCVAYIVGWRGVLVFSGLTHCLYAGGFGLMHYLPFVAEALVAARGSGWPAVVFFPLGLAAGEYWISKTGFGTWTHIAYTQAEDLPLMQILSVTGLAGVPLLIGWGASVTAQAWIAGFIPVSLPPVGVFAGTLALVHLAGALRLSRPPAASVRTASLTVANEDAFGVAWGPLRRYGKLPSDMITTARVTTRSLHDRLFALTRREAVAGARLVQWSESNALVLKDDEDALIERGRAVARECGIYLLMSLATITPNVALVENKAIGISPDGELLASYLKTHPTPFEGSVRGSGKPPVIASPYGKIRLGHLLRLRLPRTDPPSRRSRRAPQSFVGQPGDGTAAHQDGRLPRHRGRRLNGAADARCSIFGRRWLWPNAGCP